MAARARISGGWRRGLLRTALGLLALVLLVLATVIFGGRSHWGRQRVLSIVLPAIEQQLVGKLRIGALDGDFTHMLVLRNVELDDAEGRPAVRLPYVGLRYNLLALLGRTLHILAVDIKGAEVHARWLKDGRLNLAALTRPGDDSPPATGPLPIRIIVSGIDTELAADFDGRSALGPLGQVRARLHLRGGIHLRPDRNLSVEVQELRVAASDPLTAALTLRGELALGLLDVKKSLTLRGVALSLVTDGAEVTRLAPAAGLRGPLSLGVKLDGLLEALAAQLTLALPKGQALLQAKVGLLAAKFPWQMQLSLSGFEPAALRQGLPAGQIDLAMSGSGSGNGGRLELQSLAVKTGKNALHLSGNIETPEALLAIQDPLSVQAALKLQLEAHDLAELARLAAADVPVAGALLGSVQVDVNRRVLHVATNLHGAALRGPGFTLSRLQLAIDTTDLVGKVQLAAENLFAGGQRFARLALTAEGDKRLVQLHLDGEGPEAVKLKLGLTAKPELAGGAGLFALQGSKLTGLVADLTALQLSRAGAQLALEQPAQLRLSQLHQAPIAEVGALALSLGSLRLRLGGRYETQGQKVRASIDASNFDAQELVRLLTGATTAPKSQLALHVELAGTTASPTGQVHLTGQTELPPGTLPWRIVPELSATLANRRVRGELTLRAEVPTGTGPSVKAHFDAPLAKDGTVALQLDAEAVLDALRPLLPPTMADLSGSVKAQVGLSGSLKQPQAQLKITLPRWQLSPVRGTETTLSVTYAGQQLAAQFAAQVLKVDGQPLGRAELAAQVPLHVRLDSGVNVAGLLEQLRSGAGTVDFALRELALPQLLVLNQPAGQASPLAAGTAEVAVQARGPLLGPTITARVDASGLRSPASGPLGARTLGAALRFNYQRDEAALTLNLDLDGKPLLVGKAGTAVKVAELLHDVDALLDRLPIQAQIDLLPTELPLLGSLKAHAEVKGTPHRPQLTADASATGLRVGDWPVGDLTLHAALDHQQLLKAQARVAQKAGGGTGSLSLDAAVPLPFDLTSAALKVALLAKDFRIDYQAKKGTRAAVWLARGTLDSDLTVQGGAPQPLVLGGLTLREGQLSTAALPQLIRDIGVELRAKPGGVLRLERASARTEHGRVRADGGIQLSSGTLRSVELNADIENFPFAAGSIGLWLDTKLRLTGRTQDDTLRVKVNIPSGTVRLPKLSSGSDSDLQPLGPLEDMRFTDAAARAEAAQAEAEAKKRQAAAKSAAEKDGDAAPPPLLPPRTLIAVELPPAFAVSGPEVRTSVTGHLDIEMGGRAIAGPIVTGDIHSLGGWVEILGRRYQLDRTQVSMSGEVPPNPLINVVLWRKIDDAKVFIEVGGTARSPIITFRSDPAIYDQAQVIGIVLSGSRGGSIQQQALGALSGLLIGKIKDSLGSAVPVDVIKFDVGGNDASGANQSSLEVGKYLRDNLYLSYTHRFGSPSTILHRVNNDQVSLEWSFLPDYQINLLAGDQGVGALNLYWTRRF